MNTITINAAPQTLLRRFAWKEYRMLRGFWLAGFAIAFLIQSIPAFVRPGQFRSPFEFFMIAWVAAALYTVGAAITMFCAETEDRTRDYLRLLPGDWRPIFAAKAFVTLGTALLLGCALSLSGWWFAGYSWPTTAEMQNILAVMAVAILEGLAWGLLFSLWWKQPLLAAVAAIALASLGTQLAILGTTESYDAFSLEAYQDAIPGRLLICAAVFVLDLLLGSQWLYPRPKRTVLSSNSVTVVDMPVSNTHAFIKKAAGPRLKMFTRLFWQTWRESWKSILVAVPLAFVLMAAFMIPAYIQSTDKFLQYLPFVALIPPALLGALAFRADQASDHRLFLATHAVRPRYVWLARQAIWFGTVLILAVMIHFLGSWIMQSIFHDEISKYFDGNWSYYTDWLGREFSTDDPKWAQAWRFEYMQQTYVRGVVTTWAAFVAAYGVGQLCSMVLKQSLLAGFLAILLALILAIWSVLMYLWQMNPHGFVLPIGLAALLATWLRVPNWILGKNHWRHWLAPAAVLLIPLVGMVALVPTMRMAQLTNITREKPLLNELFAEADSRQAATKNQVAQTALEYERLAAEIDEQEEMFMKSMHSHPDLANEGLQQLAECVTELTKRSESQFPVLHVLTGSPAGNYLAKLRLLLTQDSLRLQSQGKLDLALDRLGAELRLLGHMLRNQQSHTFAMLLQQEGMGTFTETFAAILDWAQATDQTSDQLKSAIGTLQEVFAALPQPSDAIYAYREHVRQIILEENPPSAHNQLAAAFNRLPGEQERALRALDILAAQAQEYVIVIEQLIQGTSFAEPYGVYQASQLRSDLRSAPWTNLYAIYPSMFRRDNAAFRTANQLADACATSFLVANEFRSSGNLRDLLIKWTVSEAQRRALLVQLALLAYRLDHGAYPETLAELVPDYLPTMINDPYSGEAFEYRPEGLNLPLVDGNEYVNRRAPNIPPGTSLLWSVGLGNNVLEEFFEYPADFDWTKGGHVPVGAEERAEAENSGRQVLRFNPTEHFGGGTFRLVFPLPKIEAKPAVKE